MGVFEGENAGSYLVNVIPGPQMAPLTTGATIPFSNEYRIRQTNMSGLTQLAKLRPQGGEIGLMSEPLDQQSFEEILKSADSYRGGLPKARSMQDIWPWCLLIGAVCLFADIFVRRVSLDYAYPAKWLMRKLRPGMTQQDTARQQSLNQLRSKKSQVTQQIDVQKSTTRFEASGPVESGAVESGMLDKAASGKSSLSQDTLRAPGPGMAQKEEAGGYTSRLLAAKKAAQKKTGGDQDRK